MKNTLLTLLLFVAVLCSPSFGHSMFPDTHLLVDTSVAVESPPDCAVEAQGLIDGLGAYVGYLANSHDGYVPFTSRCEVYPQNNEAYLACLQEAYDKLMDDWADAAEAAGEGALSAWVNATVLFKAGQLLYDNASNDAERESACAMMNQAGAFAEGKHDSIKASFSAAVSAAALGYQNDAADCCSV